MLDKTRRLMRHLRVRLSDSVLLFARIRTPLPTRNFFSLFPFRTHRTPSPRYRTPSQQPLLLVHTIMDSNTQTLARYPL